MRRMHAQERPTLKPVIRSGMSAEEWRARWAERHRQGAANVSQMCETSEKKATLTLDDVRRLTEAEIAGKTDPDFTPSESQQALALCERLLAIGEGDRLALMLAETTAYITELTRRGWITKYSMFVAWAIARGDFEDARDQIGRASCRERV